jgi:DegV family protein with EDD domain
MAGPRHRDTGAWQHHLPNGENRDFRVVSGRELVATKIVTDSLSDITSDMAEELGITVVPLTVLFGREAYLDRVTISPEDFYQRLIKGPVWPTTTQPSPAVFAKVYDELAEESDEILVVTLSSRMSGTYGSATAARPMAKKKAHIEVIDSEGVAMGLGLIVMAAARLAQKGMSLTDLSDFVTSAKKRSHFIAYFDTLKYLAKGGRIGKAQGLLGSVLSVKPILTVKDGEMAPVTRVRSLASGMEHLYGFVSGYKGKIEAMAVEHTTDIEEADKFVERISEFVPMDRIIRSTVSPVLGTYGGPGAVAVTVLETESK